MEITLYLDVVLAVNFSVDLILLLMLRSVLKLKGRWIRLAAGSAAGAIFSALFLWLWLWLSLVKGMGGGLLLFLRAAWVLAAGWVMVRTAFSLNRGEGRKAMACLFLCGAAAGGILQGVGSGILPGAGVPGAAAAGDGVWAGGTAAAAGGAGFSQLGLVPLLLLLAAGCLGAEGLICMMREAAAERECRYQVTLCYRVRKARAEGFLDTGNRLRDPVSGRPVHGVSRKLLEELCPAADKLTPIPYRTIDGGGSVLWAVTLDKMEVVQGKRAFVYERPLVAASPASLQMRNGCRILLHT